LFLMFFISEFSLVILSLASVNWISCFSPKVSILSNILWLEQVTFILQSLAS
jgi:hypothetical protein